MANLRKGIHHVVEYPTSVVTMSEEGRENMS